MRDRRSQASEDLGINRNENEQIAKDLATEQHRKDEKQRRRQQLEQSNSYALVKTVKTIMDGPEGFPVGLDAVLGFFIPGGVGDIVTQALNLPSIYIALVKVRSIPLTLAVIYNMLADVLKGMVPFFIGDIWDAFNRSFAKNYRLITGFVEDDKDVIEKVNKDSLRMGILIAVFCALIYLLWRMLAVIVEWVASLF